MPSRSGYAARSQGSSLVAGGQWLARCKPIPGVPRAGWRSAAAKIESTCASATLSTKSQAFVFHPIVLDCWMIHVATNLERHEVAEISPSGFLESCEYAFRRAATKLKLYLSFVQEKPEAHSRAYCQGASAIRCVSRRLIDEAPVWGQQLTARMQVGSGAKISLPTFGNWGLRRTLPNVQFVDRTRRRNRTASTVQLSEMSHPMSEIGCARLPLPPPARRRSFEHESRWWTDGAP
jgi:hypothetical protein